MDALIMTCGTGGGHNAAGAAVREELERRGHNAVTLNPYTLKSSSLAEKIDNTYIKIVQNHPSAFGAIYMAGEAYRHLPVRSPVMHINRGMADILEKYLEEHRFDVIIMSHLFPAEITTNLKRRGTPIPKTVYIDTDYTCIPFAEEVDCDAVVVASPDVAQDCVRRGIPEDRLHPLGIPVSAAFSSDISPEEAKAALGLDTSLDYILISGGSMGAGNIELAIDACLEASAENERVVVICGSNSRLYDSLSASHGSRIILVGQTDHMAYYLRASRVYLSKPGGLSSTEAAVSGIPLIHLPPIPGCETHNAQYFSSRGMSVTCRENAASIASALDILRDDSARAGMIAAQRANIPKSSAADIADLAQSLCGM